jgi:hypothetical protein
MSSGSSTESQTATRPWHLFLIGGLLCATAAVLLATDTSPENLIATSAAIGAAAGVGLAVFRTLRPLAGDADDDTVEATLTARARGALQREKALVLRSIKELEFDRAMGKIGESDYEEMTSRLRSRALGLMRELEEAETEPFRQAIEEAVAARRRATGQPPADARAGQPGSSVSAALAPPCPSCSAAVGADDRFCPHCGFRLRCRGCGARIASGARFCASCGVPLEERTGTP